MPPETPGVVETARRHELVVREDFEAAAGALSKSESAEAVGLNGAVVADYLHENLWLADELLHRNKVGCLVYGIALGILAERHKATGQVIPGLTVERDTVPA